MYERLKDSEIEFMECYYDPVTFIENVIPLNINSPTQWSVDSECLQIRNYQFAMIGYDYLYEDDDNKSPQINMRIRKGMGDIYNISARNIGKTLIGLVCDDIMTVSHYLGDESCIGSFDDKHLKEPCEKISNIIENHLFFQLFHLKGNKKTVNRNPHRVQTQHGHLQLGVNEKINGKTPGTDFHGKHYKRFSYDEASYMSKAGTDKRVDSGHSIGYIERLFGIPDLRFGAPLGDILRNPKKRNWVCNIPQFVRDDWDSHQKERMVSEYQGENSLSYKLNVAGDKIEGAESKWDIERIQQNCFKYDKFIKFFEVAKDLFKDLDQISNEQLKLQELNERLNKILIIDRLPCKQIIIASDIGTTGSPSEVTIFFGSDGHWKYEYQISLFKLITKEQAYVFKWLYDRVGGAFINLDCTNADGRAIRDELIRMGIPEENLSDFRMSQNLIIGFEKDDKTGQNKLDSNRKPILKEEYTKVFAIQQLENLLYNGKVEIPLDEKFLKEFSGFFETRTGSRPSWGTKTTDHLHDSFLLFALGVWQYENKILKNNSSKKRHLGHI